MREYALASHIDMVYGSFHLHGEVLPGLMPQIVRRGFGPDIVVDADSYAQ